MSKFDRNQINNDNNSSVINSTVFELLNECPLTSLTNKDLNSIYHLLSKTAKRALHLIGVSTSALKFFHDGLKFMC